VLLDLLEQFLGFLQEDVDQLGIGAPPACRRTAGIGGGASVAPRSEDRANDRADQLGAVAFECASRYCRSIAYRPSMTIDRAVEEPTFGAGPSLMPSRRR